MPTRSFVFTNKRALGDVVVSTALMRDIHLAYGSEVRISYVGKQHDLVTSAPYIKPVDKSLSSQTISLSYGHRKACLGIDRSSKSPTHFIKAYHELFEHNTGIHVPLTELKPDLHVDDESPVQGEYWVVATGGKRDFMTKIWDPECWSQVFESMPDKQFVRVGAVGQHHVHHPIQYKDNVLDLRSQTTTRELAALIRDSAGVVCGVTSLMHIAAAFDKPCVVIAYLHTLGMLPCCGDAFCWRSHLVHKNDGTRTCKDVVDTKIRQPKCLTLIEPRHIISSIKSYCKGM